MKQLTDLMSYIFKIVYLYRIIFYRLTLIFIVLKVYFIKYLCLIANAFVKTTYSRKGSINKKCLFVFLSSCLCIFALRDPY